MVATIRCHSPTSGFWRECRFERVKLNVLIAWALLGSLKTSRASAFWIIYRGLMAHDGSPAKGSLQWSSLGWRHEVVQHAPLESDWSSWWRAMQTCDCAAVVVELVVKDYPKIYARSWCFCLYGEIEIGWEDGRSLSLLGWAAGVMLSPMLRCLLGSYRGIF